MVRPASGVSALPRELSHLAWGAVRTSAHLAGTGHLPELGGRCSGRPHGSGQAGQASWGPLTARQSCPPQPCLRGEPTRTDSRDRRSCPPRVRRPGLQAPSCGQGRNPEAGGLGTGTCPAPDSPPASLRKLAEHVASRPSKDPSPSERPQVSPLQASKPPGCHTNTARTPLSSCACVRACVRLRACVHLRACVRLRASVCVRAR